MPHFFCRKLTFFYRKAISTVVLLCFSLFTVVGPAGSQTIPTPVFGLTASFQPPVLLGMTVHPENPLLFDFIVDRGQDKIGNDLLKDESTKLIKYFLTSMTIPDKDAWVNLSPYEKDRIIPDALGQTEMGRQMLEQDYVLKQLAASLTNPDTELGKKYWDEVNKRSTDVGNRHACSLQNKVWIVPDGATVVEKDGFAYITESKLTVMLDEDYEKNLTPPSPLFKKEGKSSASTKLPALDEEEESSHSFKSPSLDKEGVGGVLKTNVQPPASNVSTKVFRELILPKLIEEVNTGKNFAATRQVYQSVILAAWYKRALKDSLLGKIYADKSKIEGVETDVKDIKQKVYDQYLEAFKKGAYNVIKEEDGPDGETIPRKYFSGGSIMVADPVRVSSSAALNDVRQEINQSTGVGRIALVAASTVETPAESRAIVASANVISFNTYLRIRQIAEETFERIRYEKFDNDPQWWNNKNNESQARTVFITIFMELNKQQGRSDGVADGLVSYKIAEKVILNLLGNVFEKQVVSAAQQVAKSPDQLSAMQVNPNLPRLNEILSHLGFKHIKPLGEVPDIWEVDELIPTSLIDSLGIAKINPSLWLRAQNLNAFITSNHDIFKAFDKQPVTVNITQLRSSLQTFNDLSNDEIFKYLVLLGFNKNTESVLWEYSDYRSPFFFQNNNIYLMANMAVTAIRKSLSKSPTNGISAVELQRSWSLSQTEQNGRNEFSENEVILAAERMLVYLGLTAAEDRLYRYSGSLEQFDQSLKDRGILSASSSIAQKLVTALVATGLLLTPPANVSAQEQEGIQKAIQAAVAKVYDPSLSANRMMILSELEMFNSSTASDEFKASVRAHLEDLFKKEGYGLIPFYNKFDPAKPVVLFIHGASREGGAAKFIHALALYHKGANLLAYQFDDSKPLEQIAEKLGDKWQSFLKENNVNNSKVIVVDHSYGAVVFRQVVNDAPDLFRQTAVFEIAPTYGGSRYAFRYGDGKIAEIATDWLGYKAISEAQYPNGTIQNKLFSPEAIAKLDFRYRLVILVDGDPNNPKQKSERKPEQKLGSEMSAEETNFSANFQRGLEGADQVIYLNGKKVTHGNAPLTREVLDALGASIQAASSSSVDNAIDNPRRNFLKAAAAGAALFVLPHAIPKVDAANIYMNDQLAVVMESGPKDTFEKIAADLVSIEVLNKIPDLKRKEIIEIAFQKFKQENPTIKLQGVDIPLAPETKFLISDTNFYLSFAVYIAVSKVVAQRTLWLPGQNIPVFYVQPEVRVPAAGQANAFGKYGIIVNIDDMRKEILKSSQNKALQREAVEIVIIDALIHELVHVSLWDDIKLSMQSAQPWIKKLLEQKQGPLALDEVWAYLIQIAQSKVPGVIMNVLGNYSYPLNLNVWAKFPDLANSEEATVLASRIVIWSILDELGFTAYLQEEAIKRQESYGQKLSSLEELFYRTYIKREWESKQDPVFITNQMSYTNKFLSSKTTQEINQAAARVFERLSGRNIFQIPADIEVPEEVFKAVLGSASSSVGELKASSTALIEKDSTVGGLDSQVGGIDFDPTKLNLQIKRDGRGVPLPLPEQDLENINIKGLYPVIINILPVNAQTLPILGQIEPAPSSQISKG